jgi:hypothetical protein
MTALEVFTTNINLINIGKKTKKLCGIKIHPYLI